MLLNKEHIMQRLMHDDPNKKIVITPFINPEEQVGPVSIDLRLGTEFEVLKSIDSSFQPEYKINPEELEEKAVKQKVAIKTDPTEAFYIQPGDFVVGYSIEHLKLPFDLLAKIEGRNSWGKIGLFVNSTAGLITPNFSGTLTFALKNMSSVALPLYPGVRIAQIYFHQTQPMGTQQAKTKEGQHCEVVSGKIEC